MVTFTGYGKVVRIPPSEQVKLTNFLVVEKQICFIAVS